MALPSNCTPILQTQKVSNFLGIEHTAAVLQPRDSAVFFETLPGGGKTTAAVYRAAFIASQREANSQLTVRLLLPSTHYAKENAAEILARTGNNTGHVHLQTVYEFYTDILSTSGTAPDGSIELVNEDHCASLLMQILSQNSLNEHTSYNEENHDPEQYTRYLIRKLYLSDLELAYERFSEFERHLIDKLEDALDVFSQLPRWRLGLQALAAVRCDPVHTSRFGTCYFIVDGSHGIDPSLWDVLCVVTDGNTERISAFVDAIDPNAEPFRQSLCGQECDGMDVDMATEGRPKETWHELRGGAGVTSAILKLVKYYWLLEQRVDESCENFLRKFRAADMRSDDVAIECCHCGSNADEEAFVADVIAQYAVTATPVAVVCRWGEADRWRSITAPWRHVQVCDIHTVGDGVFDTVVIPGMANDRWDAAPLDGVHERHITAIRQREVLHAIGAFARARRKLLISFVGVPAFFLRKSGLLGPCEDALVVLRDWMPALPGNAAQDYGHIGKPVDRHAEDSVPGNPAAFAELRPSLPVKRKTPDSGEKRKKSPLQKRTRVAVAPHAPQTNQNTEDSPDREKHRVVRRKTPIDESAVIVPDSETSCHSPSLQFDAEQRLQTQQLPVAPSPLFALALSHVAEDFLYQCDRKLVWEGSISRKGNHPGSTTMAYLQQVGLAWERHVIGGLGAKALAKPAGVDQSGVWTMSETLEKLCTIPSGHFLYQAEFEADERVCRVIGLPPLVTLRKFRPDLLRVDIVSVAQPAPFTESWDDEEAARLRTRKRPLKLSLGRKPANAAVTATANVREITVIDIKSGMRARVSHMVQVTLYWGLIKLVLAARGIGENTLRLADTAEIWHKNDECGTNDVVVSTFQPQFLWESLRRHFFGGRLQELFAYKPEASNVDIVDSASYHISPKCQRCQFKEQCMRDAVSGGRDLSLVPVISKYKKQSLQANGLADIEELHTLLERYDNSAAARGVIDNLLGAPQRTLLDRFGAATWRIHVEAVRSGRVLPTMRASLCMPHIEHCRLAISLLVNPATQAPFAAAAEFRMVAAPPVSQSRRSNSEAGVPLAGASFAMCDRSNPQNLVRQLAGFISDRLREVHIRNDQTTDESQKLSLQCYVFSKEERNVLVRHLVPLATSSIATDVVKATDVLFALEPANPALAQLPTHPHLLAVDHPPACIVAIANELAVLFAFPAPHIVWKLETCVAEFLRDSATAVSAGGDTHAIAEQFLSDNECNVAELKHQLETLAKSRAENVIRLVDAVRARLAPHHKLLLPSRLPAFALQRRGQKVMHLSELSRLCFVSIVDTLSEYRRFRARRFGALSLAGAVELQVADAEVVPPIPASERAGEGFLDWMKTVPHLCLRAKVLQKPESVALEVNKFREWIVVCYSLDSSPTQSPAFEELFVFDEWRRFVTREQCAPPLLHAMVAKVLAVDTANNEVTLQVVGPRKPGKQPGAAYETPMILEREQRLIMYELFANRTIHKAVKHVRDVDRDNRRPMPLFRTLLDRATRVEWAARAGQWNVDIGIVTALLERTHRIGLTPSQRQIFEGLFQKRLLLVQGPPGTGKTFLLAALILLTLCAHREQDKPFVVILTAFTHNAVNNVIKAMAGLVASHNELFKGMIELPTDLRDWIVRTSKSRGQALPPSTTLASAANIPPSSSAAVTASQSSQATIAPFVTSVNSQKEMSRTLQNKKQLLICGSVWGLSRCLLMANGDRSPALAERGQLSPSQSSPMRASTPTGSPEGSQQINTSGGADLVIIEEASQLSLLDSAIPVHLVSPAAGRLLLIGDPLQLRPLVHNRSSSSTSVHSHQESLFEFLDRNPGTEFQGNSRDDWIGRYMLTETWRMNSALCDIPARVVYQSPLYRSANAHVAAQRLAVSPERLEGALNRILHHQSDILKRPERLRNVEQLIRTCADPAAPLCVIQVLRGDRTIGEASDASNQSGSWLGREEEVIGGLVASLLFVLSTAIRTGPQSVHTESLGTDTPSTTSPVRHLRQLSVVRLPMFCLVPTHRKRTTIREMYTRMRLGDTTQLDTVVQTIDKAEGQEADAVVVDYTFFDDDKVEHMKDHLFDFRRLNVATTRAKKKLILVVSSEVLCPWSAFEDDAMLKGVVLLQAYVDKAVANGAMTTITLRDLATAFAM